MSLRRLREEFEDSKVIYESAKLTFNGVDGYDVYNCSVPFWHEGRFYLYGRVEKLEDWSRSRVFLFENTGPDEWTRVANSMIYQLEDPNIALVGGKLVLGGVFVYYEKGRVCGLQNMFYRGTDLEDMYYFTMGPMNMKDIRLVELPDHRIGVFSRPRNDEVLKRFGSYSAMGFTVINDIDELCGEVIDNAPYIPELFGEGEWGGANQAYYLESGKIGIIGHKSYKTEDGTPIGLQHYLTVSFVFDMEKHRMVDEKIIATRGCFPDFRAKRPFVADCSFPSGIVMREDGRCDLYSGIGDSAEGRAVIDYPFEGYGAIVNHFLK